MKYEFIKSPNFTPVDKKLIIVHWPAGLAYTAVNWCKNPISQVSYHYIVFRTGRIVKMVEEKDISWGAGYSSLPGYPTDWNGKEWSSLNPCAINICLEGPPSTIPDMECWESNLLVAGVTLCKDIATRHIGIKITDHSRVNKKKIDVKKGTGNPEDIFPWEDFVEMTGLQEA